MNQQLRKIGDLDISSNPRMPQADITSAPELFGDPFGDIEDGDFEDGDFEDGDLYGDAEDGDLYGDINDETLGAFRMISGDIEEGGPRFGKRLGKWRNPALIAGGALAAGATAALTARAIKKAVARKRANRAAINQKMAAQRSKQTLHQQKIARQNAGKISRNKKMPFFQVIGAKLNSSPIDPLEGFVADMFKYNLDRQASDTPFYQESAIGVFGAGLWTCTATGVVNTRYYTALILQLGINYLNAAPGTIFQVTATIPTINGLLTVSAQPWIFTIENKYDVRFMFFPWQLVSNRPLPVLGSYNNANPITVIVAGLPAASAVSLVVPGSLHPWTVAMRNSLI